MASLFWQICSDASDTVEKLAGLVIQYCMSLRRGRRRRSAMANCRQRLARSGEEWSTTAVIEASASVKVEASAMDGSSWCRLLRWHLGAGGLVFGAVDFGKTFQVFFCFGSAGVFEFICKEQHFIFIFGNDRQMK